MKFCETTLMVRLAAFHGMPLGRRDPDIAMCTPDRAGRIIRCFYCVSKILHAEANLNKSIYRLKPSSSVDYGFFWRRYLTQMRCEIGRKF
jgi:hypothetical protein